MKARKFIVKAESLSWHYLFNSQWTALSLRIWGYATSGPSLSAWWCSGPNKQLPAAFTDLKRGLPSLLHLHVWCLVQITQETDWCSCRSFTPAIHLLYFFFTFNFKKQLVPAEEQWKRWTPVPRVPAGVLGRAPCLAPLILRSCRGSWWTSSECSLAAPGVGAPGQGDWVKNVGVTALLN